MDSEQGVITTRLQAAVALTLTGWILFIHVHPLHWGKPLPWAWLFAGVLPTWAVAIVNTAFYGFWIWFGVAVAFAPIRKEEKAVWVTSISGSELIPVRHLFPKIEGVVHSFETVLYFTAFLAAMALLVSLWADRARSEPGGA